MNNRRPESALVVGAGSIGRRHLSNLRILGVSDLSACDPHPDRLAYVREHFEARPFANIEAGLQTQPDIVLVCSPPNCHVSHALQALRSGAHVFVEKPLSHSTNDLELLLSEQENTGLALQVGYNLRFHAPIQKLRELIEAATIGRILWGRVEAESYLPDWRPWQDYRESYTSQRVCGGGIILDGSHELDYVTWLFGPPSELTCMAAKVSRLEIDVEDCATILLRFPDGSQIDVHVDFMQRFYSRGCVLAGENGKLQWDFGSNTIVIQRCGAEVETIRFDSQVNDMYVAELQHFLDCIESGGPPKVTLRDAIRTLRIALAARTAAEEKRWISNGW